MKNSTLYYSVGALLYCPANHPGIADSIIAEKFEGPFSLALCLEDTIPDNGVAQAEEALAASLKRLFEARRSLSFFMPRIFIRVRNAGQMERLMLRLSDAAALLSGFIMPKFDLENADAYIAALLQINARFPGTYFMMPILESPSMIDLRGRIDLLYALKEKLDAVAACVLNIRVGGNDLCHAFGFRRHSNESIYELLPVAGIFTDVLTVFGADYVVSGPVWEYYNGSNWAYGLYQELLKDRLIGFVGKTVIHPKQIPIVNQAYAVTQEDYDDARAIQNWSEDAVSLVSGSIDGQRMNERKTHANWAEKILYLAEAYGVQKRLTYPPSFE